MNHSLRPSEICILTGAGISLPAPSSFPLAAPVLRHILRELGLGYATRDAYLSVLDVAPVKPRMNWEYLRFEFIMDRLARYDPQESFLRSIYTRSDARPNSYHIWLAKMLSLGANVITTNFDLMIENAFQVLETSRPTVLITEVECDNYCKGDNTNIPDRVGVFQKLHGSVNSTMAARFPRLVGSEGVGPRYEAARSLMFKRTLLVLGYSGGDDFDVMPMLGFSYEYDEQKIIWIEHAGLTTPESISPANPPEPIHRPRSLARGRGQFERIRGDSVTTINLLCHESCPRLDPSEEPSIGPLPSLKLTDWERLALLHTLMEGSLYAEQTGLTSSVGQMLSTAAQANEQSKCASLIHHRINTLFIKKDGEKPTESEIIWAIGTAEVPLRQRLTNHILLLEAWLQHQLGAYDERDRKLRALMAWCNDNDNWEIFCSAPDWAFRYCEDLLENGRRRLYLKVGWDIMVWHRDLEIKMGILYVVEDAESLMNDGIEMDYSYWDYQSELKSLLFYNERLGNVAGARISASHLQRVEWVWNQFDKHKTLEETVKQLDKILSRRVRKLTF